MAVRPIFACFFFFLGLTWLIPKVLANIAQVDEVWLKRQEEAEKINLAAYHQDPHEVNEHLNFHVRKALEEETGNSTRRELRSNKGGKCLATNPIDRCWRCRPDWAQNRKKLADCVLGFGRKTKGGKNGKFYVVTDSSDNDMVNPKPGTLRWGVIQKQPLWIIFARDMIIKLKHELIMTSFKTIDARGAKVHIAGGAGINIQNVQHVIIHGLRMHDIVATGGATIRDSVDHFGSRTGSEGDAITVFGSSNIWLDHLSLRNCKDGLIDVIAGSTAVTISNNHMTKHRDVFLFGSSDGYTRDKIMQITVAFNHFGRGLLERMPRCRFGFVHVVNNDYTQWNMCAIGGSSHPTIISHGNRYVAPHDPRFKEVTCRNYATESEWSRWTWRSEGDRFENGAFFRQSGDPRYKAPHGKKSVIKAKPAAFVPRLTRFAGSLTCQPKKPC